jgi:hypothetical protein
VILAKLFEATNVGGLLKLMGKYLRVDFFQEESS